MMEIFASQPGMKYYDEPFNIRRDNVAKTGLFPTWQSLMPETGDAQAIIGFLNGLTVGDHPHMNPPPFRPHHRLMTHRIVFKIHELEHLIGRIARECGGQVVYLLRHPIPTTLSRTQLPRLELFLNSPYYDRLIGDGQALRAIKHLGNTGSRLQKGIVSWCYENFIPLKHADFDGLIVSYEELVLNPVRSCDLFLDRLQFDDRPAMLAAFGTAAANISMSSDDTFKVMTNTDQRVRATGLVSRWVQKVSAEERRQVTEVMDLFGLDVYSGECVLPHHRYLHFEDTRSVLAQSEVTGAVV